MTTINTVIRKASLGGITDAFDITGLLMILIVFCALAFQESDKEHIFVDMFVEMLPKIARKIVKTFLDLLTVGMLGFLSYAYFTDIVSTYNKGAATQVLRIPEWPFVIVVAIAVALFTLTVLLNMIDMIMKKDDDKKPENPVEESP